MRNKTKPRARHPHNRLTVTSIRAKTAAGRYADGNGLYLVVDPSGAKRWIWRGVVHGKRTDLGLGGLAVVTLAAARDTAITYRRIVRTGGSPKSEHARLRRIVPTFIDAARQVHAEHRKTFKNEKHAAQWLSSLEHDVFPVIGRTRLDVIDAGAVLKVLTPIWTTKPETARRLKQRMRLVFEWGKASGFVTGDNPTDGITKVLPKHRTNGPRHHPALPYQDVPAFLKGLRTADATESARLAFELLILTAARTNEVLLAQWEEVDTTAKTWIVPGARMKAGREHRIPLSSRCVQILKRAKAISTGSPYVFPGRSADKPLSNMAFLMLLRRLERDDITTHGFRSSFRDWAAEKTNLPRAVVEAALAQVVKDKTEAAYFRTDLFDRRRELMDLWARFATTTPVAFQRAQRGCRCVSSLAYG